MTGNSQERRRALRVNANLKLEVRLPGEGVVQTTTLETINISSSGVYFMSDHFIAPMTKLAMEIEVTVPGATDAALDSAIVSCEGLVVRIAPEAAADDCLEYEVAVFFTNISSEGMANLERHISLLISDRD